MRLLLTLITTLLITSPALAGTFKVTNIDDHWVIVDYTGMVEFHDAPNLRKLMEKYPDHQVMIFIDSGGGYAYAGCDLYWEAKKHDNLHTVGGYKFGAWSAAAMFWLGGQNRHVAVGGVVGFHMAYCDPHNPPGCDTKDIDAEMQLIFEDAFGCERASALRDGLEWVRGMFGVAGWVAFIDVARDIYVINTRGVYMEPYLF